MFQTRQQVVEIEKLAVLLIIRCLSALWGELAAKWNKHLEQTLKNKKKGQEFLFVYCLFSPALPQIGASTVQTRVTCVSHLSR